MFSLLAWIYNGFYTTFFIFINLLIAFHFLKKLLNMISGNAKRTSDYALVTGCDTGFGHHTALALSKEKMYVFAGCITSESVEKLNEDKRFTGTAFIMDITKMEDIQNAKHIIEKEVKDEGLWCVINNAGVCQPAPIEWVSVDDMKRSMDVNVWGTVNVTKVMLPLVKKCRGRIVVMTSIHARASNEYFAAYCMSKYALEAFADSLRYEMKPWGVSVHIMEPGGHSTGIHVDFQRRLEGLYDSQPKKIQEEYGKDFVVDILKARFQIMFPWIDDLHHVVNAYVHAALSSNPKLRYVIGLDANTAYMFLAAVPTYIGDFVKYSIVTPVIPAAMKNTTKQ